MFLNRFRLTALVLVAFSVVAMLGVSTASAAPHQPPKLFCTGTYKDITVKSVTVPEFADCTLVRVHVLGNVFAKNTPGDVRVLDSTVDHNIMVDGATGLVKIGSATCGVDPAAGNNIKVTNSNDVIVCFETVDNNLMVRGNHGRISIYRNTVGVNIQVTHNKHYDGPFGVAPHPTDPDVIRVHHNTYGVNLFVKKNADRPSYVHDNHQSK